jgi:hypothetical protein
MSSKIQIESLACGAGDIKLSFNSNDPMEVERAKRVVVDMLRRGYSLFIQGTDGTMTRVAAFDEKAGCYLIACGPEIAPTPLTEEEKVVEPPPAVEPKRGRGRPRKAVKMSHAKVVAVGRSAGG